MGDRLKIADNVQRVRERIAAAAARAGRDAAEVELVGVTKGRTLEEIEELIRAGVGVIGESKVQEAKSKAGSLAGRVSLHMIGHLQRNKVKEALRIFDLIHSVDSLKLAEEIESAAERKGEGPAGILLEVNVSGEGSKYGFSLPELFPAAEKMSRMKSLRVEGLMTMAPLSGNPGEARPVFRKLRECAEELAGMKIPGLEIRRLSMGMSRDYEAAVEEGATMVRVGTALFEA